MPSNIDELSKKYYKIIEPHIVSAINSGEPPKTSVITPLVLDKIGFSYGVTEKIVHKCIDVFIVKTASKNDENITTNKVEGGADWREFVKLAKDTQELNSKINYSQAHIIVKVKTDNDIILLPFADMHIGSTGTDYDLFETITNEILNTPNLYVILEGDELELAIKQRNVLESTEGQCLNPNAQIHFFESWLKEIRHKVLWCGWGNHGQEREEKVVGYSMLTRIIGKENNLCYHNGIGHIDLYVNEFCYKIVAGHKFQGNSYMNRTHSQQRYMRFQGNDREIAISGHTHTPGYSVYYDGETQRLAINTGSLQVNSGYSKRYYSLFTIPLYPVIKLGAKNKYFQPFTSLMNLK